MLLLRTSTDKSICCRCSAWYAQSSAACFECKHRQEHLLQALSMVAQSIAACFECMSSMPTMTSR